MHNPTQAAPGQEGWGGRLRVLQALPAALAAVLAMVPISHSAFWGPMAITIGAGLLGATALTLLFLPALYALWYRRRIRAEEAAVAPSPSQPAVERAALAKTA